MIPAQHVFSYVWHALSVAQRLGPLDAWSESDRARLRATLAYAKHTHDQAAEILASEFGVDTARQENVTRWASGDIKGPRCAAQLRAYCDAYGPARAPESIGATNVPPVGDEFVSLAGRAADQPLFGDLQVEFIRAMNRRLGSGPPLSAEDRETYLDQKRILGLEDR